MPIMTFSEPRHIPLLLGGDKKQTTRLLRKIPLRVGDILYCYYRPRLGRCCANCINDTCYKTNIVYADGHHDFEDEMVARFMLNKSLRCLGQDWNNYLGEAIIVEIDRKRVLRNWSKEKFEAWAEKDGFSSLSEAESWFNKRYKKMQRQENEWTAWPMDIIAFEPKWVVQGV